MCLSFLFTQFFVVFPAPRSKITCLVMSKTWGEFFFSLKTLTTCTPANGQSTCEFPLFSFLYFFDVASVVLPQLCNLLALGKRTGNERHGEERDFFFLLFFLVSIITYPKMGSDTQSRPLKGLVASRYRHPRMSSTRHFFTSQNCATGELSSSM